MLKDHLTTKDVIAILDVPECSAVELLDGVIEFEEFELYTLAKAKGITIEQLLK